MASIAPLTRPRSVASRETSPSRRSPCWVIAARCPPGWWALLERSGGGVFHSPAGLGVAAPAGASVFAELHDGEQAIGLAAGVALRCRIGFGRWEQCRSYRTNRLGPALHPPPEVCRRGFGRWEQCRSKPI